MKLKSYAILTSLLLLLSTNTYALEIHNGHLVNHKEWTTGNAKMTLTAQKNQHKAAMLSSKKMMTCVV
jgi:alkyl sulfatase BDS1-like metallo-beta-lactamase superfamily hydrolase